MALNYFKRYRMEIDLEAWTPPQLRLPAGYRFLSWEESLVEAHADAKYRSFRDEIDANVFPCFTELGGCQRLMQDISGKLGFLPEATWLLAAQGNGAMEYCGTVQGIRDRHGWGAIQNLGVVPEHRDRGLGTCLLLRALFGFRTAGLRRAFLEVTAQNDGAIRLYQRFGFRKAKTIYKVVEVAYS